MVTPTAAQDQIRRFEGLPLLVVAPAGCGKTEALALRVLGLIERGQIAAPRRVLVTTFSNRARDNVRDRLQSYLSPALMRRHVTIANFHGFSARVFKAHAAVLGLDPDLTIPESDWVREQCQSLGLDFASERAVQEALRKAKQQGLDDQNVEIWLATAGATAALQIERKRIRENRLTYDDLPRLAELILAHDAIAQLYQSHFAAVVVDEFQDLTPQQLRIVNRIGHGRTTYAGDLAQGIYGFAGAKPAEIHASIASECPDVIEFSESHRSSPAVLRMVNSLSGLTGGQTLSCAIPESWPGQGLAACGQFATHVQEANWAVEFARSVSEKAPNQRIGIIARTAPRRRFVDAVAEASGLPTHRWDDGVLDSETARIMRSMLGRLSVNAMATSTNPVLFLREAAEVDSVQDPDTRGNLADALGWCLDRIREGLTPAEIKARIRVGDENTLLKAPGLHLLSGHIGKGQQFDWVVVVGAEEDVLPDFRAETHAALLEEARILSVMVSRARHGVVVTCASRVPTNAGKVRDRKASRFFRALATAGPIGVGQVEHHLRGLDWSAIAAR